MNVKICPSLPELVNGYAIGWNEPVKRLSVLDISSWIGPNHTGSTTSKFNQGFTRLSCSGRPTGYYLLIAEECDPASTGKERQDSISKIFDAIQTKYNQLFASIDGTKLVVMN